MDRRWRLFAALIVTLLLIVLAIVSDSDLRAHSKLNSVQIALSQAERQNQAYAKFAASQASLDDLVRKLIACGVDARCISSVDAQIAASPPVTPPTTTTTTGTPTTQGAVGLRGPPGPPGPPGSPGPAITVPSPSTTLQRRSTTTTRPPVPRPTTTTTPCLLGLTDVCIR